LKLQTDFKYQKEFGNKKETNFGKKRERNPLSLFWAAAHLLPLSSLSCAAQKEAQQWPSSIHLSPTVFAGGFL
jgi:hypothetical protein